MININNKNQNTYLVTVDEDSINLTKVFLMSVAQNLGCPARIEIEANGSFKRYERNKKIKISEEEVAELFKNTDEELTLKEW